MKQKKCFGFYLTLILSVLGIGMAILYAMCYSSTSYMSWKSFGALIAGSVLAALLLFTKFRAQACIPLWLGSLAGLLFYVYGVYFYVSSVMVGIQGSTFSGSFKICTGGMAGLLVLSILNVFLPQVKEEKEEMA